MYESLTEFIPKVENSKHGEWIFDHENDGTPEHPIRWPWVRYEESVLKLGDAVNKFVESYEDMGLRHYRKILEKSGFVWGDSLTAVDVTELDAVTVLALLVCAFRGERFCDGLILSLCESGCIVKWLNRLKEIDEEGDGSQRQG